jgi:hypothetical protein
MGKRLWPKRSFAAAVAGLACLGMGSTPAEPVLVDRVGVWNLERLGSDAIVFSPEARVERRYLRYRLPLDVRQGPQTWYLVHLHLRLRLKQGSGLIYANALHNGHASARIKFEVREEPGGVEIKRSSTDLLDGSTRSIIRSRVVEVRYRNFLPYDAVRSGDNTLTFQIEQLGSTEIEQIEILPASGLEVSKAGPARLTLRAVAAPRGPVAVGQPFNLRVTLKNVGDRATRYSAIALDYPRDELRVSPPTALSLGPVQPGRSISRRFALRAIRPGRVVIGVFASSSSNRPGVSLSIRAKAR